jgi:hypothetical protein
MRRWTGWLVVVVWVLVAGCEGERGLQGLPGATGPTGPTGSPGDAGLPEGTLQATCMSPCHSFTGIVEQYHASQHYAVFVANLGGQEVASWTGPTACGNCHAIDALELRVQGEVDPPGAVSEVEFGHLEYAAASGAATEATYAGQSTVAAVYCTTCHKIDASNDPHKTGASYYQAGTFGFWVNTLPNEPSWIEKSPDTGVTGQEAGNYTTGNVCIFCHRARKDVGGYIPPGGVKITSVYWGPHEGPQADVYTGKGGFELANKSYGSTVHTSFDDGCVRCHMPPVANNDNYPSHSFYAQLSVCQGCHAGATSFDVNGVQTDVTAALTELQTALNAAGYLTRASTAPYTPLGVSDLGADFDLDTTTPQSGTVDQLTAGAIWNYLIIARGSGLGVHNPRYTLELLYDSIEQITGNAPTSITTRP